MTANECYREQAKEETTIGDMLDNLVKQVYEDEAISATQKIETIEVALKAMMHLLGK